MTAKPAIFSTRASQAAQRISALRENLSLQVGPVQGALDEPTVCIYATGSLARGEANDNSDLDAFFMLSGKAEGKALGRIRDVKIMNAVLSAAESNGFPDFSGDGEYLQFLHIEDIIGGLGSRNDDYNNAFTARMLMILESDWLYNRDRYLEFRKRLIEAYFKDFHDHSKAFKPIFLLNDILRFWRTLCLNYEHGRMWRGNDVVRNAKGHLSNLKLKFSRLNICFSFIVHLLQTNSSLSPDDVVITSSCKPLDRLIEVGHREPSLAPIVAGMLEEYAWFLEATSGSKDEVLTWISNSENRVKAFNHADKFVNSMGSLVRSVAEKNNYFNYLII
jgi:hypothetical protein